MGISNIICKCWDQNICPFGNFSQNRQFGDFGNTSEIRDRFGKSFSVKTFISPLYDDIKLIWIYLGALGSTKPLQRPPKKVRKFCCFDLLNGESRRQTPMDLKSGITSKTKLLQKNWTHLQNLCIKVDQIAYAKSLEIFVRQEQRNFDMWELHFLANALLKRKM